MCRLTSIIGLVLCVIVVSVMSDNFGTMSEDASDVTWAHAVNSREELHRELSGPVDFLEADVSLGIVSVNQFGELIPVMAHPPAATSDVSLEMWLDAVIESGSGKGIKLDFKSLEVVEPSLVLLKERAHKLSNSSVWLNADILPGPTHATGLPVQGDLFVLVCQEYLPQALLSVGWTTYFFHAFPQRTWTYDWGQVRSMAHLLRCVRLENPNPTFTFPVRGVFASRSIRQLQWLLEVVPSSSLTVWTGKYDPLTLQDLLRIRTSFPKSRVFYDLPDPLALDFRNAKNSVEYVSNTNHIPNDQWMILMRDHQGSLGCTSHTYISEDTIAFGNLKTAVLLKKLFHMDKERNLRLQGRIQFFGGSDDSENQQPGNQQLAILILDVNLHFKNSSSAFTDRMNMSVSDSNVWWPAINASRLFTFDQNSSSHCRAFKLDTTTDRSFQAWTVSCEDMAEDTPFEELTRRGVAQVPFTKRLVLPEGPFMIGFLSSGDEHVVIHDLVIADNDISLSTGSSTVIGVSFGLVAALLLSFAIARYLIQ